MNDLDAGRILFAASRSARTSTNDADRLRKYLAKYELTLSEIQEHAQDQADLP